MNINTILQCFICILVDSSVYLSDIFKNKTLKYRLNILGILKYVLNLFLFVE